MEENDCQVNLTVITMLSYSKLHLRIPNQTYEKKEKKNPNTPQTFSTCFPESVSKKAREKTKNSESSEEHFGREFTYKEKEGSLFP